MRFSLNQGNSWIKHKKLSKEQDFVLKLKEIDKNHQIQLEKDKFIKVGILLKKTTKLIKIRDISDIGLEQKAEKLLEKKKVKNELIANINFRCIGISLIGDSEGGRIEPLFVYMEKLNVYLQQDDNQMDMQFRVKYINIDNNTM